MPYKITDHQDFDDEKDIRKFAKMLEEEEAALATNGKTIFPKIYSYSNAIYIIL